LGAASVQAALNDFVVWRVDGRAQFEQLGRTVAGVGDVDGDGVSDFAVGLVTAGDLLGWSVAGVGDVNGDGTRDLLMGAPGAGGGAGGVHLVSGTAAGALLASANGDAAGDAFGWSVAPAGDVNGDGRADALVGAPFAQGAIGSLGEGAGRAYAYVWLSPSGFTRHLAVMGDGPYDALGFAVAGAGESTGDGRADFVAGAPGGVSNDGPVPAGDGYARLFSGADGSVWRTWGGAAPGPGPHHVGDLLGYAVAALADCDGDGQTEIAVGAPQTWNGHGAVYVFQPNAGVPVRIDVGDEAGDLLGVALASGGDVWAGPPGQQEILVGASGTAVDGNAGAGSAFVLACRPVPKPDIAVSPVEVNFGDVTPGADVMRLVTIRNEGGAALTISSLGLGAGAPPAFTLGLLPALPLVLQANAGSVITVQFAPTSFGPAGARLDVASNDPDEPVVSAFLGGRGVAPEIEVAPSAVAFGDVRVGDWTSALVTIRNVGNVALVVNSLTIPVGSNVFTLFPPAALVPVQRVFIADAAILEGRIRFAIQTTDPANAHRIEEATDLGAPEWSPVPDVDFTPLPGDLIQAEFDLPAESLRLYRVIDTAPAPAVPEGAMVVPFPLMPGEERRLHVLFIPDAVGAAAGTLRVESTDADEMLVDVALTGAGT
jgi:hypothetical protein